MEIQFRKLELAGVAAVLLVLWLIFVVLRFESIASIAIAALLLFIIGAIALLPRRVIVGNAAVDDERLKKMYAYAAYYSADVTFVLICLLGILVYAGIVEMDARQIVALVLYAMGLSRAGFYAYFKRKGDVA